MVSIEHNFNGLTEQRSSLTRTKKIKRFIKFTFLLYYFF